MFIMILLMGIIIGLIHLGIKKNTLKRNEKIELFLLYLIIFAVGIIGTIAFIGHVFFPEKIAPKIGWQVSPFETEVGIHDGAWALLGFLAIWISGSFWHAIVIGWSFFMIGAGIGHIKETIIYGNYAPYNFSMIFFDIGSAILMIIFWILWIKTKAKEPA